MVEGVECLLKIYQQDSGIFPFQLDMLHKVEEVQYDAADIVLFYVGFLVPPYDPIDSWFDSLGNWPVVSY